MFINRISHSKEDCYKQCPGKYKLRYIDRVDEDPKANKGALEFGSFIHEVFEYGLSATTVAQLYEIGDKIKSKYRITKQYENLIETCYKNFLRLNASLTKTISAEQKLVTKEAGDYEIISIIDRLVEGKDGGILILDYKTGRTEKTKFDLFKDRQLKKYVYSVHKEFNIPIEKISAGHFYPRTNNLVVIKYTKSSILAESKQTANTVWEIRKKKKTDFPFKKNQFCNWCSYRIYCDLFNDSFTVNQRLTEAKEKKSSQK